MKSFYSLIISIALFICCAGCSTDSPLSDSSLKQISSIVEITEASFMEGKNITTIEGDFGVYQSVLSENNAIIGISSSRNNPLAEERIAAFYIPRNSINLQSYEENDFLNSIRIDGKTIFSPSTKSEVSSVKPLFGNHISFGVDGQSPSTRTNNSNSIYAPEIISIGFPASIVTEENPLPLCYYKDFVVKWNADPNNHNGVIIIVKWSGIMSFGEDYPSTYIAHTICCSDSGNETLNENMFDDIPDGALCSLWMIRGDVNQLVVNDISYTILAETHAAFNFILIKHIK